MRRSEQLRDDIERCLDQGMEVIEVARHLRVSANDVLTVKATMVGMMGRWAMRPISGRKAS